jgi:hypothetical protein
VRPTKFWGDDNRPPHTLWSLDCEDTLRRMLDDLASYLRSLADGRGDSHRHYLVAKSNVFAMGDSDLH